MSTRFEGKVILLTGASSCNPDKQMGFAGETVWRFFKEGGAGAIITDVQDELAEISNKSINHHAEIVALNEASKHLKNYRLAINI